MEGVRGVLESRNEVDVSSPSLQSYGVLAFIDFISMTGANRNKSSSLNIPSII